MGRVLFSVLKSLVTNSVPAQVTDVGPYSVQFQLNSRLSFVMKV